MNDADWRAYLAREVLKKKQLLSRLVAEHREYVGGRESLNPDPVSKRQWADIKAVVFDLVVLAVLAEVA